LSKASRKLGFEIFAGPNGQGIDLLRTLQGIKNQFGDISKNKELSATFEAAFGQRAGPRISLLLAHLDKFQQAMTGVANSAGATDRAFGEFNARGSLVFTRLHQAVTAIEISLGQALLPAIEMIGRGMLALTTHIQAFAAAHPQLTKFIAIAAALGAVLLIVVGGLAVLAAGIAFVGSALAPLIALTGLGGVALAGIAAAAVVAASAIIAWWGPVKSFFTTLVPQAFEWGVNLLKTLAKGIASAALWPVHAIENVFGKVAAYIPHSPAKVGPLRDLHRVRIVETIAESIRPAPMVNAIRRVALVTALAVPMIASAAAPTLASTGAAAGRAVVVNISPVYNINATTPEEFVKAAKDHARELVRIVKDALEREDRKAFK